MPPGLIGGGGHGRPTSASVQYSSRETDILDSIRGFRSNGVVRPICEMLEE